MSLGELLCPNDWAECKQCGVGKGKPLQQTLTDDGLDVGTCSPGRPARTRHGSGGPRPVRRAFEKLAQIIRHLDGFIVSRCKKRVLKHIWDHPQGSMTNMNVFRWLETTETTKPKIWVWRAKRSARFFFVDVRVESIFWGPSAQAGPNWALHTRRGSKRCKETCSVCHPLSSREFRIKVQTHQLYMTACKLLRILGFVISIWFHPVLKFTASPEWWGGPHCSTYLPALSQPNTVECDWNILRGSWSEWPMCRRVLMIFCSYPLVI